MAKYGTNSLFTKYLRYVHMIPFAEAYLGNTAYLGIRRIPTTTAQSGPFQTFCKHYFIWLIFLYKNILYLSQFLSIIYTIRCFYG